MKKIAFELKDEKQAHEFLDTVGKLTEYIWNGDKDSPVAEDADNFFTLYPVWIIFHDDMTVTWSDSEKTIDNMLVIDDEGTLFGLLDICDEYDMVNHPAHYTQGKVECIDAMEMALGTEAVKGYCLGAVFKYLWRRKDKGNEEQDIQKSLWYFDYYKQLLNR